MENEIVYLFSSNYRPLYKNDNLSVLALPDKFVMHFRYDRVHVDPKTLEILEEKTIEGKPVLVIIVTRTGKRVKNKEACEESILTENNQKTEKNNNECKFYFYPIRFGTIKKVIITEDVIHVYFELDKKWVKYGPKNIEEMVEEYTDEIKNEINNPCKGIFMTIDKKLNKIRVESNETRLSEAWRSIVDALRKDIEFRDNVFYRIEVYKVKKGNLIPLTPTGIINELTCGYEFESRCEYLLRVHFYDATKSDTGCKKEDDTFRIEYNPQILRVLPSEIEIGFRVDLRDIVISPIRTRRDKLTLLSLLTNRGAKIRIPIKVKKENLTVWWIVVGIGLFISGISSYYLAKWAPVGAGIGTLITLYGLSHINSSTSV